MFEAPVKYANAVSRSDMAMNVTMLCAPFCLMSLQAMNMQIMRVEEVAEQISVMIPRYPGMGPTVKLLNVSFLQSVKPAIAWHSDNDSPSISSHS